MRAVTRRPPPITAATTPPRPPITIRPRSMPARRSGWASASAAAAAGITGDKNEGPAAGRPPVKGSDYDDGWANQAIARDSRHRRDRRRIGLAVASFGMRRLRAL